MHQKGLLKSWSGPSHGTSSNTYVTLQQTNPGVRTQQIGSLDGYTLQHTVTYDITDIGVVVVVDHNHMSSHRAQTTFDGRGHRRSHSLINEAEAAFIR